MHRLPLHLALFASIALPAAGQLEVAGAAPRPAPIERLATQLLDGTVQELTLPAERVPFATPIFVEGGWHVLELEPVSLRAPDYKLLVQGADGRLTEVEPSAPATYRGSVLGFEGSRASGSLRAGGLTGTFTLRPGQTAYGIEPLAAVEPSARPNEHLVYDSLDVVDDGSTCGALDPPIRADGWAGSSGSAAPGGGATTVRVCEIACDADVEFYNLKGSSVASVEADIESVLNGVQAVYENDVEILYEITAIIVRTSQPDPYTTADAGGRLNEFQATWNNNHGDIHRDVAHLFTGVNLVGSTIGIASLNVICSLTQAYGLSQSTQGSFTSRVGLTAHELGHNWSAQHCNGLAGCQIMCSGLGGCGGLAGFGPNAISSILNKKNSSSCLSLPPPAVAATLTNVAPSAVQPLSATEVTLTGFDFTTASAVQVGGTVLSAGQFQLVNDTKLEFIAPEPTALGTVDVTVTNVVGVSNAGALTYTALDGPLMLAPSSSPAGQLFTWNYGAAPFEIGFLLVALNGSTFDFLGLDLLLNAVNLDTVLLGATGTGQTAFVMPPSLPPATILFSQLFTFDLVNFDASNIGISVLSF